MTTTRIPPPPTPRSDVRIDVVTIFPAFFDVLEVSLLGRARDAGILDVRVHDLRDFTAARPRPGAGPPDGGGAGRGMRPEPGGRARAAIAADAPEPIRFVFPSPAGAVFTQAAARSWAASGEHLVFGCGRYEGIDERVFSYAATLGEVSLTSIGDYVLNGGEVAAMAMIEAVGRLIPGVVGNPESLIEESHEDGLLEYPSFTKPAAWRGYDVPDVLLSGHHGRVADWRREQQIERTRARRPDLLPD